MSFLNFGNPAKKWILKNLENVAKKKLTTSEFFQKLKIFEILICAHAVAAESDKKQKFYGISKFFVKIGLKLTHKKFSQKNIKKKCARIFS